MINARGVATDFSLLQTDQLTNIFQDMHYADFGEDEVSSFVRLSASPHKRAFCTDHISQSAALLQAIKEYETNKWKVIGQKVGKPAKVRDRRSI